MVGRPILQFLGAVPRDLRKQNVRSMYIAHVLCVCRLEACVSYFHCQARIAIMLRSSLSLSLAHPLESSTNN